MNAGIIVFILGSSIRVSVGMRMRPSGKEAQGLRLLCLPGARASKNGLSLGFHTVISTLSSLCVWKAW